jgi:hypothetical protein
LQSWSKLPGIVVPVAFRLRLGGFRLAPRDFFLVARQQGGARLRRFQADAA